MLVYSISPPDSLLLGLRSLERTRCWRSRSIDIVTVSNYANLFQQLLNLTFLLLVMRGFMTQRGLPDNPRSARYILKDYVNGKLLYAHAPPTVAQAEYHTHTISKVDFSCLRV